MTETSARVSVVIPTYNTDRFLRDTIDSVLQQDYPSIECIVVDGGSTDDTLQILASYGDRISWISEPDEGHADAINKGWRMSHGDILTWLNADDMWAVPDAASAAAGFLDSRPDVDIVYGDCGLLDEHGALIGMCYLREWDLEHAVVNSDHCIPQPAAFIRRSALERAGWLDTEIFTKDRELWLRIGLEGKIEYWPRVLAHARNTQGISFVGERVAPAIVQLMEKFFLLPNVPPQIRAQRRRAMSNSYLRGADYAYEGGRQWSIVFRYTVRALLLDPTNAWGAIKRFAYYYSWESVTRSLRARPRVFLIARSTFRLLFNTYLRGKRLRTEPASDVFALPFNNAEGHRQIEWSWITANMSGGPGHALVLATDPEDAALGLFAAQRCFDVTSVDMPRDRDTIRRQFNDGKVRSVLGDIRRLPLPEAAFDLIVNPGATDHLGLSERSLSRKFAESDGDLDAMQKLRSLLKPQGSLLLTIPVGLDATFGVRARVYGPNRFPRLISGFVVTASQFWIKDGEAWRQCDRDVALNSPPLSGSWSDRQNHFGIGCFLLRKAMEA